MTWSILYSFYGDDFTGSTDVLQQLASAGIPAVLFLRPPTEDDLRRFEGVQAIGLAGDSRSRDPAWMDANLPQVFLLLRSFGAPINHYKVCSTFDSSPSIGSIGRAIEIGLRCFPETPLVPIVVAAPHLRRYVAFGNLFAAASNGAILRIDRHPMSRHPVTPMLEADLRKHLGAQTQLSVELWDLTVLTGQNEPAMPPRGTLVLLDGLDDQMQQRAGELIWRAARVSKLFSASSSGLTAALVKAWRREGMLRSSSQNSKTVRQLSPILVVSGSCSTMTEQQIRYALDRGFSGLHIDSEALFSGEALSTYEDTLVRHVVAGLRAGQSMLLYTALGTPTSENLPGSRLGEFLGGVLRQILTDTPVRRVLLCGGDTCSHAVQQLDLLALTWMADIAPGAPLCRAHANSSLDALELVLKGGQVGDVDFFDRVLQAHTLSDEE